MLQGVLDWVYPPKCGLCARLGKDAVCDICHKEFLPLDETPHQREGALSEVSSLFKYEARAAQAVRRLKYSRITSLIYPLASMMREGYDRQGLDDYDLILPIPIHWRRKAWRGFNQAEALASALPKDKLRVDLLTRIKHTTPQVQLNREQRAQNLVGAFRADPAVAGKAILLIDDVCTSGHTAEQCALALLEQKAYQVGLLSLTGES